MMVPQVKNRSPSSLLPVALLFFACYFLYVWLWIEPCLIYHALGRYISFTGFSFSAAFFYQLWQYPGGPIEYVSAFLSQYYYYSWLGAVIITVIAWQSWQIVNELLTSSGAPRSRILAYCPAILLAMMYSQYSNPLAVVMAALAGVWFFGGYKRAPTQRQSARIALFVPMFVLVYYLAGGGALLFALLVVADELLLQRRVVVALLCLIAAVLVPYLSYLYIFDLELSDIYFRLSPLQRRMDAGISIHQIGFYFYFPAVFFAVGLWQQFQRRRTSAHRAPRKPARPARSWPFLTAARLGWLVPGVIVFAGAALGSFLSFDPVFKRIIKITYLSDHGKWPAVLEQARTIGPGYNLYVNHHVNKSLYHTGRMGDEMFSYVQQGWRGLLLFPQEMDVASYIQAVDLPLRLGEVNLAERYAYEALANIGDVPAVMQQLVLINTAKGFPQAARVFLNRLSEDVVYRNYAQETLQRLAHNPDWTIDEHIWQIRSFRPATDHVDTEIMLENLFSRLCARNRHNRMAFEYLMATYLLTKQLNRFVATLDRLDDFDYDQLPRHYEEAILLYQALYKRRVDLHDRAIRPQARERCDRFGRLFQRHKNDDPQAWPELVANYGNTYYFYFFMGASGIGK